MCLGGTSARFKGVVAPSVLSIEKRQKVPAVSVNSGGPRVLQTAICDLVLVHLISITQDSPLNLTVRLKRRTYPWYIQCVKMTVLSNRRQ